MDLARVLKGSNFYFFLSWHVKLDCKAVSSVLYPRLVVVRSGSTFFVKSFITGQALNGNK
jgi:hypothetical protein